MNARATLLTTCLLAVLPSVSSAAGPATQPTSAPTDEEVQLGRTLSRKIPLVNLTGRSLERALEFVRDAGGVNVVVNWRELAREHVSDRNLVRCSGRDMPLADVLRQVLDSSGHGISYNATDGAIYVTSRADLLARPGPVRVRGDGADDSDRVSAALDKRFPDVNVQAVPLRAALEMVGSSLQVPVEVDWDSLQAAGVNDEQPVSLRLKGATGAQVLDWILRPLQQKVPIVYTVRGGKVTVLCSKDRKPK